MPNPYISGTGFYVPAREVTNQDLMQYMDTSDEWIRERTGIGARFFADGIGEGPSDLAIPATKQALENAGLTVADIDFIIFATSTPDYYAPGSACLLQDKLGFELIGALDIRVQCSGFLYGLSIAEQYIKTGQFRHILLVGAEVQSSAMNLTTEGRDTAVIFGDGAGAAIISATDEDRGILSTHLHAQGKYAKELWCEVPASGLNPRITPEMLKEKRQYLYMNGREVFRHAIQRFPEVINEALDANGMTTDDVTMVIPHQANYRITQFVQKRMKLPPEKVYSNIHKYGNTTAATIPIALHEVVEQKLIKRGDVIVMAAFGSGFTWASALLKW
ncbi:MAG: ketoacyl-ACP synthase III [FCB group bacterium]|nr:ketoacyl-ACP synthase III [FCB group bacterium]